MIFPWRLQLVTCVCQYRSTFNIPPHNNFTKSSLWRGFHLLHQLSKPNRRQLVNNGSFRHHRGHQGKAKSAKAKSLKLMYYTREQQQSFAKLWQYLATTFSLCSLLGYVVVQVLFNRGFSKQLQMPRRAIRDATIG